MMALATLLALILFAIAALHFYWGLGGFWPGTDATTCVRAIAGFKGANKMPSMAASFAVAAALLVAMFIALALGSIVPPIAPLGLLLPAGIGASFVFVGRGLAAYTPAWRKLTPEMPFARNDVRYYGPLCLIIGVGFAILSAQGLPA